jgi:hypothetical protein
MGAQGLLAMHLGQGWYLGQGCCLVQGWCLVLLLV